MREVPKAPVREEKRRVRVKAQTQAAPTVPNPTPVIAKSEATKPSFQLTPVGDGSLRRATPRDEGKVFRAKAQTIDSYEMPPLDMLREHGPSDFAEMAPEVLDENARELEGVLDDFGVKGEIVNVRLRGLGSEYNAVTIDGVRRLLARTNSPKNTNVESNG